MATTAGIKAGKAFIVIEAIDKTGKILSMVAMRLEKFADRIVKLGRQLTLAAGFASVPLLVSLREYAEFDDMMRRVEGSAEGTAGQMLRVRKQARQLGKDTRYAAKEIGGLQFMLAQKGFNRSGVFEMTPPIVTLARAAGTGSEEDVTQAADLTATVMRSFEVESKDTTRVVDLLAKAANASNLSLYSMSEAFSYIGPMAKIAKWSIEDTIAMMGVLGNFGIEASMAGTAIRGMTLSMANPKERDKFNKALMESTGNVVEFVDATGNFRKPLAIMHDLGDAMKGLGSAEQLAILGELFHVPQMAGAATLTKHAKQLDVLMEQLADATGYAKQTADLMDAGIGGALAKFLQQIKAIGLSIGEALVQPLMTFLPIAGKVTAAVMDWIDANQFLVSVLTGLTVTVFSTGGALLVLGVSLKLLVPVLYLAAAASSAFTLSLKLLAGTILMSWRALKLFNLGLNLTIKYTKVLVVQGIRLLAVSMALLFNVTMSLARMAIPMLLMVMGNLIIIGQQAANAILVLTARIVALGTAMVASLVSQSLFIFAGLGAQLLYLVAAFGSAAASAVAFLLPFVSMAAPFIALAGAIALLVFGLYKLGGALLDALGSLAASIFNAVSSAVSAAKDAIIWAFMEIYGAVARYLGEVYRIMAKTFGSVMIATKLGEYKLAFKVFAAGAIAALAPIKHLFEAIWATITSVFTSVKQLLTAMGLLGATAANIQPPLDVSTWTASMRTMSELWRAFWDRIANTMTAVHTWIAIAGVVFWAGMKNVWLDATHGIASILWDFVDNTIGPFVETIQGLLIKLSEGASAVGMDNRAADLMGLADKLGAFRSDLANKAKTSEAEYQAAVAANIQWRLDMVAELERAELAAIEARRKASEAASEAERKEMQQLERELNARIAEVQLASLKADLDGAFQGAKDIAEETGDYLGKMSDRFKGVISGLFSGAGKGAAALLDEPLKANMALEKGSIEAAKAEIETPAGELVKILEEEKKANLQLAAIGRALQKGALAIFEKG